MEMITSNIIRKKFQHLGLKDSRAIMYSARVGIRTVVFYSFAEVAGMPEKKLAGLLHLHPRTIQNYKEQQKSLDPVEGEHLLQLIALYLKGEELFGAVGELNHWLQTPFWNSKEKPIDWLITPGGVSLVSDELDKLAHGYAV
jgi:putative toxin-antitoxin system antitoxin component (TIGR02293 family)